jgi:hypothetical protein
MTAEMDYDVRQAALAAEMQRQIEASPYDCSECPEDRRPHLHCPWGGLHKHYGDEGRS